MLSILNLFTLHILLKILIIKFLKAELKIKLNRKLLLHGTIISKIIY